LIQSINIIGHNLIEFFNLHCYYA